MAIWGAPMGKGAAYTQAREEYATIMKFIVGK